MSAIDDQAVAWVTRRYSGKAGPSDEAAFRAWHDADPRHAGAYLRAEAAWVLLDRAQVLSHGDTKAAGELIHPATPLYAHKKPGLSRRAVLTGAVAASFAAVASVGLLLRRPAFATARGELRKVPLADRTLAAINTDSRIEEAAMTARRRDVHLVRGEVWFEVAKNPDAPFTVSAGDVRVRAVGTAFSVRRRDGGADILVTEGKVETWSVRLPDKRLSLTAGDKAYVADTGPEAAAFQPDEVTRRLAWRERRIILHEESLGEAAAEFNRYNDQQIVVTDPALATLKLVGGFDVDQPEQFARSVHAVSGAPVSIRQDRIIIGTLSAS